MKMGLFDTYLTIVNIETWEDIELNIAFKNESEAEDFAKINNIDLEDNYRILHCTIDKEYTFWHR